jgi:hypothetical protein
MATGHVHSTPSRPIQQIDTCITGMPNSILINRWTHHVSYICNMCAAQPLSQQHMYSPTYPEEQVYSPTPSSATPCIKQHLVITAQPHPGTHVYCATPPPANLYRPTVSSARGVQPEPILSTRVRPNPVLSSVAARQMETVQWSPLPPATCLQPTASSAIHESPTPSSAACKLDRQRVFARAFRLHHRPQPFEKMVEGVRRR